MKHSLTSFLPALLILAASSCEKAAKPEPASPAAPASGTVTAPAVPAEATAPAAVTTADPQGMAQKAAIDAFRQTGDEIKVWARGRKAGLGTDPYAPFLLMGDFVEKLKAIKTDNLPDDLKQALQEAIASFSKLRDLGLPNDPGQLAVKSADPEFRKPVDAKIKALAPEIQKAALNLTTTADKYGVKNFGAD